MQSNNRLIIADGPLPPATRGLFWGTFIVSLTIGTLAAMVYARRGLTLSHYDARAHLVVARRIIDSLTPGWRQIGAVWLPLPHLLNLWPAQWDWNYRTGYASVAISVGALSIGLAALARYLVTTTGSIAAAIAGPALVLLNPNVLYLQSTPMTEPLLFGLSLVALAAVDAWMSAPDRVKRTRAEWALVALALSRYEGWAIAGALVVCAVIRRGRAAARLGLFLLSTIAAFLVLGWASTGQWFVASGFFVPDNPSRHQLFPVLSDVVSSTRDLGGDVLLAAGLIGVVVVIARARRSPEALAPLALVAAAALPMMAFYEGHPHRVRYMVPLVVAAGTLSVLAVARLPKPVRAWAAVGLCTVVCYSRPPLDRTASMVTEAQWEVPFQREREAVSRYMDQAYDGTPILASMGSLGHYMQEASAHGLVIANFVHEGNGDLWASAFSSPSRYVRWIAIEERAEGGDALAVRARHDSTFLAGFSKVAEGGGVALYKRLH